MNCKNRLCIFQREGICLRDEIELDDRGCCANFTLADKIGKEIDTIKEARYGEMYRHWQAE